MNWVRNIKKNNLTYALKNGQLIHISSVESGLKCDCICPSCGEHLIAKKGNKVVHHFAHKPNSECAYGYQTSLHLLAKEILFECKEITIPEVILDFSKYGGTYKIIKIADSKRISLDKVVLEKKEGDVIPDIIGYCGNKKLFIEIYVTHKIDENKYEKLKKLDISTIEINLSDCDEFVTKELLKSYLLDETDKKKWIYNSLEFKWYNKFIQNSDIKQETENSKKVMNCPIAKRKDKFGRTFAIYIDDCIYCDYCVGATSYDDYLMKIKCTGRMRLSEISDFKISYEERLKNSNEYFKNERQKLILNNICPYCNNKLITKNGKNGEFIGCSNYPYCKFTLSIDKNTGELILK